MVAADSFIAAGSLGDDRSDVDEEDLDKVADGLLLLLLRLYMMV